jgi:hypothetical protein
MSASDSMRRAVADALEAFAKEHKLNATGWAAEALLESNLPEDPIDVALRQRVENLDAEIDRVAAAVERHRKETPARIEELIQARFEEHRKNDEANVAEKEAQVAKLFADAAADPLPQDEAVEPRVLKKTLTRVTRQVGAVTAALADAVKLSKETADGVEHALRGGEMPEPPAKSTPAQKRARAAAHDAASAFQRGAAAKAEAEAEKVGTEKVGAEKVGAEKVGAEKVGVDVQKFEAEAEKVEAETHAKRKRGGAVDRPEPKKQRVEDQGAEPAGAEPAGAGTIGPGMPVRMEAAEPAEAAASAKAPEPTEAASSAGSLEPAEAESATGGAATVEAADREKDAAVSAESATEASAATGPEEASEAVASPEAAGAAEDPVDPFKPRQRLARTPPTAAAAPSPAKMQAPSASVDDPVDPFKPRRKLSRTPPATAGKENQIA